MSLDSERIEEIMAPYIIDNVTRNEIFRNKRVMRENSSSHRRRQKHRNRASEAGIGMGDLLKNSKSSQTCTKRGKAEALYRIYIAQRH